MVFCCAEIKYAIENKLINYDPIDRTYGILYKTRSIMVLSFCPWCGGKLPKLLNQEYLEELEKACGIIFPDPDFSNVPPEFRTDEWWKKRGL